MFPVNRFSINRTETDKMAATMALCKSYFITIIDVTDLTLDALPVSAACTNRRNRMMSEVGTAPIKQQKSFSILVNMWYNFN